VENLWLVWHPVTNKPPRSNKLTPAENVRVPSDNDLFIALVISDTALGILFDLKLI
jgi:hypothetical protein